MSLLCRIRYYSGFRADVITDPVLDHYEPAIPKLILILFVVLISIIQLIARGMMLNKRGVNGWKILITGYGRYLEYKTYWTPKYFRINFGLSVYMILAVICIDIFENRAVLSVFILLLLISMVIFAVNRVRMRMNTMAVFEFPRKLGLLECLGFGPVLDLICAFSGRGKLEKLPAENTRILPKLPDIWE